MIHAGGCLCGAVLFETTAEPIDAGYCHCRMCQNLSGSAVLPWASFAADRFSYTRGKPNVYASSSHGQREFCAECGSQIAFRSTRRPGTVEINIGTLADPDSITPQLHIWCNSKVAWFEIDDQLKRYPESETIDDGA